MPIEVATTVGPPYATPDDVAARWRPLTSAEQTVATSLLNDAWVQLVALADNVPGDIAGGVLSDSLVQSVIVAAVLRVMKNPDANRSESVDDYSYTRDSTISGGLLYFTDNELTLMRGARPKAVALGMANDTDRLTYGWPV